jgi:hypothetical protein
LAFALTWRRGLVSLGHRLHASLLEETFPSTRALAARLAKRPGDREFTRGVHAVIAGFALSARRSS